MKRIFLLCSFIFSCGIPQSQTTIKLEDINQHIGDSVIVCGKVYGGRYLESARNSPTLLNIGAKYPDQLLTTVIWGDVRKEFTGKPEKDFKTRKFA
jgi:hypothetical protein